MATEGNNRSRTSTVKMGGLLHRPASPSHTKAMVVVSDQEMVNVNQKLKELGIEQTIQLPQICVIGDQSTGKSSLIKALSMIRVPRDTGCCTRCPLEINLTKPDDCTHPWSCKVSLIRKYDLDRSTASAPVKSRPLGAWVELQRAENIPFAETKVKEEVSNLILRAQAATLNPNLDPSSFISQSFNKNPHVKFSPNAVRLDIVQHDLPSLSFVDLPGVVQNQPEESLIKLVDTLVSQYARSERSINLLTLSMTNDYENSKALSIILNLKAQCRTLAVMTKPDLYPNQNSLDSFLAMLDNKGEIRMDHGFHVVMMDPDVSLSHATAMQREIDYFNGCERWVNLGPNLQQKLGTAHLSNTLSVLLQEATRRSLPISSKLIKNRLEKVEERLQALPAPPGLEQMSITLTTLINDFGDKMLKLFEGGGNADKFLLKPLWDDLASGFRRKVMNSRPRLQLATPYERSRKSRADGQISSGLVDVSDEDMPPPSDPKIKTERALASHPETSHSFNLQEVRKINRRHATAGLGPQMFPGARQAMMRQSLCKLEDMTNEFITATSDVIKTHVIHHSDSVFQHFKEMSLHAAVKTHIETYAKSCCHQMWLESSEMSKKEMTKPYTLDNVTSVLEAKKYFSTLLNSRAEYRLSFEKSLHDAKQLGKPRKVEFKKKVTDLDADEWDTEIELVANVRAYHQIAASRHVDNVCQNIYARIFPKLALEMVESLSDFLGPMRPEQRAQMVEWMSENPERELERTRLLGEKASLLEAQGLVQKALGKDETGWVEIGRVGSGTANAKGKAKAGEKGKRKAASGGDDDVDVVMGENDNGTTSGTERGSQEPIPLKRAKLEEDCEEALPDEVGMEEC